MTSGLPSRADLFMGRMHVSKVPLHWDETARAVGRGGWRHSQYDHSQYDSAAGRPVLG